MSKTQLEKYKDCKLIYKLDTNDKSHSTLNEKNYEKMREALEAVGIWMDIENGELFLTIYPEGYMRAKNRNAGRSRKYAAKRDEKSYDFYRYSDIVYMLNCKKDQEIADEIGMPIATYYRHKKTMKESLYYKSLDQEQMNNYEYLKHAEGDRIF